MIVELAGSDLRRAAFAAIQRELGPQALVRFIAKNLSGKGDYASERSNGPELDVDEIVAETRARRERKAG